MCRLKILYLVAVSLGVFLVHDPRFLACVLVVHIGMVALVDASWTDVGRTAWKLRFFCLFLLAIECISPPQHHFFGAWLTTHFPAEFARFSTGGGGGSGRPTWQVGLLVGFYQIAQMYCVVLVSTIVRTSGKGEDFLVGLRGLGVPGSTVSVIDACLDRLTRSPSARTRGGGHGGQRRQADDHREDDGREVEHDGPARSPIRSLLRGDAGWVLDKIEGVVELDAVEAGEANSNADVRDVGIMSRIAFVLMSLRMLKIAPGTGMTPGHQNVIVLPLLCLAAERTHRRWGATVVGGSAGVMSIMLGLGRNGVFILPAHLLPGIVIDIGWRIVGRGTLRRGSCMVLGAIAGFGRFTGMLLVLLLLDNRDLLAAVPFLSFGHVLFGSLSGTVTHALITQARERSADDWAANEADR